MAPSTAAPSVIVALHSLVILNISEHCQFVIFLLSESFLKSSSASGPPEG
jgi:hypothetical protein